MACSLDWTPLHMGDDARLYRSYNDVCVAYPDASVPSFLSYDQQILVERNRLAGRIAHLRDDAPCLLHLCLWRLLLTGLTLHRLIHNRYPYVELKLLKCRNVVPILIVVTLAELVFGAEHILEEILYTEVNGLEELTKECQYLWVLPGMFLGIALDLYWLKLQKWKVW